MTNCMGMSGRMMMWGMGLFSLPVLVVLLLAAVALIKCLFSTRRGDGHG